MDKMKKKEPITKKRPVTLLIIVKETLISIIHIGLISM